MIYNTHMAAVKQPKYQSRQLQELTLINSLRTLYMSHERAVSQRGASREVREGKMEAYTVDERRRRHLPHHECCHLGGCYLVLHGCI
jgi:hypothetical protein